MTKFRLFPFLLAGLMITVLAGSAAAGSPCDSLKFPFSQQCVEYSKACQKSGGILTKYVKGKGTCQCWDKKEIDPSDEWCILGGFRVNYLIAEVVTPVILAKRVSMHLRKAGQDPDSVLILRAEKAWGHTFSSNLNFYLGIIMAGEDQPSTYYCTADLEDKEVVFGECGPYEFLLAGEKFGKTGESKIDLKGLKVPKKKKK